jgi:hypothetical protein
MTVDASGTNSPPNMIVMSEVKSHYRGQLSVNVI